MKLPLLKETDLPLPFCLAGWLEDQSEQNEDDYSFEYEDIYLKRLTFYFLEKIKIPTLDSQVELWVFQVNTSGLWVSLRGNLRGESLHVLPGYLGKLLDKARPIPSCLTLDFQGIRLNSEEWVGTLGQIFSRSDIFSRFPKLFLLLTAIPAEGLVLPPQLHHGSVHIHDSFIQVLKELRITGNSKLNTEIFPLRPTRHLASIDSYSKEELYEEVKRLKKRMVDDKEKEGNQRAALLKYMTYDRLYPEHWKGNQPSGREEDLENSSLFEAAYRLKRDILNVVGRFSVLEEEVEQRNRALAIKEAYMKAILENTSDQIFSVSKTGELLIANSAAIRFGHRLLKIDMSPGVNVLQNLPKPIRPFFQPIFQKALEGERYRGKHQIPIDEKVHHFEFSINPILTEEGEPDGFAFFGKDITVEEKIKIEANRQQKLLSSISQNIQEGIFRTTREDGVIYINDAFLRLFGYDSVEDVKQIDLDTLYVRPEQRQEVIEYMKTHTHFVNKEIQFRKKNGDTFWGLMSSNKFTAKDGKVYFDGAVRDVTQNKIAKETLKQKNRELIKLNEELDRFVYSTSHDLRAPLVSILGLVEVMRLGELPPDSLSYLDLMETSIKKLESFIEDIINYSQNSRMEVEVEEVDLQAMLEQSFEHFQFLPNYPSISTQIEVKGDTLLKSDKSRVNIILNNLISNAINYADPEKENPFIRVEVEQREKEVLIAVIDNGIGIEEAYHERIFDMFFRGSKRSKGSGIGLYIVKEALDKLGGEVELQSQEGKGSSFCITLPHL